MGNIDREVIFHQFINEPLKMALSLRGIDVVVGIPFYNEKEVLPQVLRTLWEGMSAEQRAHTLVVCAGDPAGAELLPLIDSLEWPLAHLEFLMPTEYHGRGASIRAICEIADKMETDVVLFAADLEQEGSRGLQPNWLQRLLEPIKQEYDFVLATLEKNFFEDLLNDMLVAPLIESFYNYQVWGALSGIYAFSHDTVEDICVEIKFWLIETNGYGFDPWLLTRMIRWQKKVCQVVLGEKLECITLDKLALLCQELTRTLFECIKRDAQYWSSARLITRTPDLYGGSDHLPRQPECPLTSPRTLFERGMAQYHSLYQVVLPGELCQAMDDIALHSERSIFPANTWAKIVYEFLFYYCFTPDRRHDDNFSALSILFCGRLSSVLDEIQWWQTKIAIPEGMDRDAVMNSARSVARESQKYEFLRQHGDFTSRWEEKSQKLQPSLVPEHYLEYVPGLPVILPKRLEGQGGKVILTENVFNQQQAKYQEAFQHFVHDDLSLPEDAGTGLIARSMQDLMIRLETLLGELIPGDLYTKSGMEKAVAALIGLIPKSRMFSIRDEVFSEALLRFPPVNVMIPCGFQTARELIKGMNVRDAVSLANLVENQKYTDGMLLWILDNLRPDSMSETEIKTVVIPEKLKGSVRLMNFSELNKLTTRIVVRPISKGVGGGYPRLRFCLMIGRYIEIASNYANLWRTYTRERKNLGTKIRNSLLGRYDTEAFSSYNIFENYHHRELVHRIRILAAYLKKNGQTEAAQVISVMCNGYGLSQVLADGTFIPCSSWSWASYSAKGGHGIPTPLSSHVEGEWFNHDFLEAIYSSLGYEADEIMRAVTQMIGEGRASENLLDVLLGLKTRDVSVVVQESHNYPPAKPLMRYPGNPILEPIPDHPWESKYVLNAAAFRLGDRVYLLYRAYGDDQISRIGLAVTDGYQVLERLPEPVFVPHDESERKGVEDPRVVMVEGQLFMLYTAFDGAIAQISAAAIPLDDFLNRRFDCWTRKGLAFENIWDKDAILFPEKIKGEYVIYHRIEPGIWSTHLDRLEFPAPKNKHLIIAGPRSGQMWDSLKIGAGTQPIKTKYGWLLIYHGVDQKQIYRLGVFLIDLENPERIVYRSPNPVLSPETDYEIGKAGGSWVPQVVFTCGAVPVVDKSVLDADDEIMVYYGAADTCLCLATARVGDLLPESVRQQVSNSASG